jgi:hypothetical protein
MIDKTHPLYETFRLVGIGNYTELRLIAEGKYPELIERARRQVQRQHYFHGLMQGSGAGLVFYWLSELVRSHPTMPVSYSVAWAVICSTTLVFDLWRWPKRRRELQLALARLERDVPSGRSDGGLSV